MKFEEQYQKNYVIKKHKESYMKFEEQLKQFKESLNFPKNWSIRL